MPTREIVVELSQGRCTVLGSRVVNGNRFALGSGWYKARRGEIGLVGSNEGVGKGTLARIGGRAAYGRGGIR